MERITMIKKDQIWKKEKLRNHYITQDKELHE